MRTKLKRAVSSGTMGSETCLHPAAEQCDLGKGFDISEPVLSARNKARWTDLFNRHA